MLCQAEAEWNFSYVVPGEESEDKILVVLRSLKMGWTLLPDYFCAATETAREVEKHYIGAPGGTLPPHPL